jgi:hypothetical protein
MGLPVMIVMPGSVAMAVVIEYCAHGGDFPKLDDLLACGNDLGRLDELAGIV